MGDRRMHRLAGVLLVLGVGLLLLAWRSGLDLAGVKSAWRQTEDFLMDRPWLLFAALVLLPGLPVPTSALMFIAGTVWRDRPLIACLICLVAMALNLSWTYWLAAKPGRNLVKKLLDVGGVRIPVLPKNNHLRALLILRLTPGIPLFFQNYLLGFLHVPFALYLPVSLACSGLIACGVVLSGAGVAGGNFMPMISGAALIVAGLVAVRWLSAKMLK